MAYISGVRCWQHPALSHILIERQSKRTPLFWNIARVFLPFNLAFSGFLLPLPVALGRDGRHSVPHQGDLMWGHSRPPSRVSSFTQLSVIRRWLAGRKNRKASPVLSSVQYQLSLFQWRSVADSWYMGSDRDGRTSDQWLRSVGAYLEWRAGECWRNLARPEHRNSLERWEYLAAARLVDDVRHGEPQRMALALPVLSPLPSPSRAEIRLALEPRAALVERLMRVNPSLTDKRLLSHLSRPKLAQMICSAPTMAMERTA